MQVIIGVDPHKASHTAVAISASEDELARKQVRASRTQIGQLLAWAEPFCLHNDRRIGVHNALFGHIVHVDRDPRSLIVEAESTGQRLVVPWRYVEGGHLAHGYATTIHKAQGRTYDRTLLLRGRPSLSPSRLHRPVPRRRAQRPLPRRRRRPGARPRPPRPGSAGRAH